MKILLNQINEDNWIILMIYWELDLNKELGFGIELNKNKFLNNKKMNYKYKN